MNETTYITMLNSFLVAVGVFYTQAYLTCLPAIASNLSATHSSAQLVFTGNILCFGISQLFYGPLSDHCGRKKCLLVGVWIALAGNILSLFSLSVTMLGIGQLIAGLGAGSCSVIPRAISKDILTGGPLVKAISYMSMASSIAVATAPILGSIVQEWFGWRCVFLCLSGLTIITLILITLFIPETTKGNTKVPSSWHIVKSYGKLFLNRRFITYTILNSCVYSGSIIYLMLSTFLFQTSFGYSARQNSFIYLLCAGSYLLGNRLLNQLAEKLSAKNIIWLGVAIIITGSILIIIPSILQNISAFNLALCGLFVHFGSGLAAPMIYKQILSIPEYSAGITSGAINAIRVLVAFVLSLSVVAFSVQGETALAYLLGMLSLVCVGIYFLQTKISLYEMEENPI